VYIWLFNSRWPFTMIEIVVYIWLFKNWWPIAIAMDAIMDGQGLESGTIDMCVHVGVCACVVCRFMCRCVHASACVWHVVCCVRVITRECLAVCM